MNDHIGIYKDHYPHTLYPVYHVYCVYLHPYIQWCSQVCDQGGSIQGKLLLVGKKCD